MITIDDWHFSWSFVHETVRLAFRLANAPSMPLTGAQHSRLRRVRAAAFRRRPGRQRATLARLVAVAWPLAVWAGLPSSALGEQAPDPRPAGEPSDRDEQDEHDAAGADTLPKAKKKKSDAPAQLSFKGRVVARAVYEDVHSEGGNHRSLDLSVPSARLDARYRPAPWLTLVLKMDATNKRPVRDAYVQGRSRHLRGRAGQFKMPLSSITTESSWTLPIARRGIIQDVLSLRMSLVGRRPGVLAAVQAGGHLDPELSLSAFQGAYFDDGGGQTLLAQSAVDAQNVVLRLAVTPAGQDVAVFGVRTSTVELGELRHYYAAGADAVLDRAWTRHGLRVWAEALAGNVRHARADNTRYDAVFWAGRAIVAWRWGGLAEGERFVEPFVYAGAFDPDAAAGSGADLLWEGFAGVNLGLWRRARLTIQLERAHAAAEIPADMFFGGRALHDHTGLVVQTGAAF
jgi:hypothetical protein